MIDSIVWFVTSLVAWFRGYPLLALIATLAIQIALVALVATLATNRLSAKQPKLAYLFCLVSIGIAIGLTPIHFALHQLEGGTWTVQMKQLRVASTVGTRETRPA